MSFFCAFTPTFLQHPRIRVEVVPSHFRSVSGCVKESAIWLLQCLFVGVYRITSSNPV